MEKELKKYLDTLIKKYEIPDFIQHDPVQFPHMFNNQIDQEVSGLLASALAYGKREKIIENIHKIHKIIDFKPAEFALNFDFKKDQKLFEGFLHRYTSGRDVALLIYAVGAALKEYNTLENLFMSHFSVNDKNIKPALSFFVDALRNYISEDQENLKGLYFLMPSPDKGSACKRENMFLRWMVRSGHVDLNLWKAIPTDKLIIPLDTHVAKQSRKVHLTERNADDWKTAEEITENLKKFDKNDPVKYDFALFSMGISGESLC